MYFRGGISGITESICIFMVEFQVLRWLVRGDGLGKEHKICLRKKKTSLKESILMRYIKVWELRSVC